MHIAVLLAVVASFFWGVGTAMQKHGVATNLPKVTLAGIMRQFGPFVWTLIKSPVWVIGLISLLGGMGCYSYSLAFGDITLVQPIVNVTMVVAALIGVFFLGEVVSVKEWIGIAIMLVGVVFIAAAAGEPTSVQPETGPMLLMSAIFTAFLIIALALDKYGPKLRAEFTFAASTGFAFGLANVMGKILTQRVIDQVGVFSLANGDCWIALLTDFPVYVVMAGNIYGAIASQAAYANGRISLISPIITIIANTTPVLAAVAFFSEKVNLPRGIGIGLAVVGTIMLATKKEDAPAEQPAPTENNEQTAG